MGNIGKWLHVFQIRVFFYNGLQNCPVGYQNALDVKAQCHNSQIRPSAFVKTFSLYHNKPTRPYTHGHSLQG